MCISAEMEWHRTRAFYISALNEWDDEVILVQSWDEFECWTGMPMITLDQSHCPFCITPPPGQALAVSVLLASSLWARFSAFSPQMHCILSIWCFEKSLGSSSFLLNLTHPPLALNNLLLISLPGEMIGLAFPSLGVV